MDKIKNIKKLKLEGKYNPIHCEEIYYNYLLNNSINDNNNKNINRNHFITTFKGNTNYHFIHGYHSKNKDNENSFYRFSNSFTKNEENKHNSFSMNNISKKNTKNRISLKDSYKDLVEKRKKDIENMKIEEEKK